MWERLERWFAKHPELSLKLNPPAKEKAILAAEKTLGIRFPDDFRASLLVHDGQSDDCDVCWVHPRHIPFAGSRYWDYGRLLFDFVPGPKGTEAQVIAREDIELNYVSATFGEMLAKIAKGLETGKLKIYREGE